MSLKQPELAQQLLELWLPSGKLDVTFGYASSRTLHCFASAIQSNRTRVPAPCCQEALPSSSHSAKLPFHGSQSRVDQGGKAAVILLENPAGNLWSKVVLPYAPRRWETTLHAELGFASRQTFYRTELAIENNFFFLLHRNKRIISG